VKAARRAAEQVIRYFELKLQLGYRESPAGRLYDAPFYI
jgi:hypothetical protein